MDIQYNVEVASSTTHNLAEMAWWERIGQGEYTVVYQADPWSVDPEAGHFEAPGIGIAMLVVGRTSYSACLDAGYYAWALLSVSHGRANLSVAAHSTVRALEVIQQVKQALPEARPANEQEIPWRLWHNTVHGPESTSRRLHVPTWEAVAQNYPQGLQGNLDKLMDEKFRPGSGGQLILWNGPPGTGKSYAIRALSYQWRKWCQMEYIVDPEKFFGNAEYLVSVLLDSGYGDEPEYIETQSAFSSGKLGRATSKPEKKWRLFVLEDTGEILAADARERVGQGLSRLLNLSDGIIGQGLQVIILVTTNEELGKLHPAVTRPGRCLAQHQFRAFSWPEAKEWLRSHEVSDEELGQVEGMQTLADLYATLDGREAGPVQVPVGFRV